MEDLEAYITQIDFEKAFNSVEWDFLFKTLKAVNFGENFIAWIKTLYTDIEAFEATMEITLNTLCKLIYSTRLSNLSPTILTGSRNASK